MQGVRDVGVRLKFGLWLPDYSDLRGGTSWSSSFVRSVVLFLLISKLNCRLAEFVISAWGYL